MYRIHVYAVYVDTYLYIYMYIYTDTYIHTAYMYKYIHIYIDIYIFFPYLSFAYSVLPLRVNVQAPQRGPPGSGSRAGSPTPLPQLAPPPFPRGPPTQPPSKMC